MNDEAEETRLPDMAAVEQLETAVGEDDTDSITAIASVDDDDCTDSVTAVAPIDNDTDSVTAVASIEDEDNAGEYHDGDADSVTCVAPLEDEDDTPDGDTDSVTAVASYEDEPVAETQRPMKLRHDKSERRQSTGMGRKGSMYFSRDSASTNKDVAPCQNLEKLSPSAAAMRRGLNIDLEQSWQRSLLKELDKLEVEGEVSRMEKHKPELMMLRHSESRDLAVEMDVDDITLGTNASSTVPIKSQLIHRAPLNQTEQKHYDRKVAKEDHRDESSPVHHVDFIARQNRSGDESEGESGDDSRQPTDTKKRVPDKVSRVSRKGKEAISLARARVIDNDTQQLNYLELEMSTDDGDACNPVPNAAACFCLGTNVLDFWLPPDAPHYRRRRMSQRASHLGDIIEDAMETMDAVDGRKHMTQSRSSVHESPRSTAF